MNLLSSKASHIASLAFTKQHYKKKKKKRCLREQHVDSAVSIFYFNSMLVFVFSGNQSAEKILPRLALMLLRLLWRDKHRRKKWLTFSS